jgi:hypothetical protein
LKDLADAVRDGTAEPKSVAHHVLDATQKLPTTVTTQDAAELRAAFGGLKDALGSKSGFSEAQGALAVSETIVALHVKAAEAGAHPTPQQSQELGELAMRLNTLAKDHLGGSGGSQVLSEVQARTEVFIKQAQEANPLFGLSMASAATPEAKPHLSEPAAKEARSETTKESSVEGKPSTAQELSKNVEPASKERAHEPVKETVAEVAKTAKESSVEGKPSIAQELSKNVEPASKERAHEPVKEMVAEVAKTARSEVNGEQHKRTSDSQVQRMETVAQRQSTPVESSLVATVARVASLASSSPAPQQAPVAPSPAAARSVSSSTQSSAYSASQHSSVRAPSGSVASAAGRTGAGSSSAPVVTPSTTRGTTTVQRLAQGRRGEARVVSTSKNVTPLPGNRATGRTGQVVRPNNVKPPGEQLAQRDGRRAQPSASVKVGRDKGVSTISPEGRGVVAGASVIASPVQRISAMLANLRALSPKELARIRMERSDRPKELQVALAIRNRSQKIVERVKTLPLKDILKIKGIRGEAKLGKGAKDGVALSPREMLARREVRFMIRELAARLQSFLNPRSMIYRRVMTEMTLADLERLVSILGGNRAVKGLRKKLKGGEVTQVFESDISNSFLSQLASAASGVSAGGDAGGSEEPSASTEGAGAEASTETSTEEATLVVDGAVPTATLSTFIMKEETVGNSM